MTGPTLNSSDYSKNGTERLCPSARCEEGAILLGIVGKNGAVGYVRPLIKIDKNFVLEAHNGRAPENAFVFPSHASRVAVVSGPAVGVGLSTEHSEQLMKRKT